MPTMTSTQARPSARLATLCAKGTQQPLINRLVALLYTDLVKMVLNAEFPRKPPMER